jgi:DNA repair protein RadC
VLGNKGRTNSNIRRGPWGASPSREFLLESTNTLKKYKIGERVPGSKIQTQERVRRPRARRHQRLFRYGPAVLSDEELVGTVLGPGGSVAAQEAARSLLRQYDRLGDLAAEKPAVLVHGCGLGRVRATRLLAAFELGFRAGQPPERSPLTVRRPEDLHSLLQEEFRGLDRERFLGLYLDTRHRLTATETVSVGSLNASLVHPREVFKPAVAMSSAAVIVAHNHPSGEASPSGDDLDLTARLDRCGDLLGIALLDHLVVGDRDIISIREYGWPAPPGD